MKNKIIIIHPHTNDANSQQTYKRKSQQASSCKANFKIIYRSDDFKPAA